MPISISEVKRKRRTIYSRGLTLLEILVALSLAALAMGLVIGDFGITRKKLEALAEDMERAIRFASDESALRNTIVRLNFILDQETQEYAVEFGPSGSFVLPRIETLSEDDLSLREKEKYRENKEKLSGRFNRIEEFEKKTLDKNLKIVGIGTSLQNRFISDPSASVYHYPTGERDDAIIILASQEEILALVIGSFSLEFQRIFRPVIIDDGEDEEDALLRIGMEIYDKWKKDNL